MSSYNHTALAEMIEKIRKMRYDIKSDVSRGGAYGIYVG